MRVFPVTVARAADHKTILAVSSDCTRVEVVVSVPCQTSAPVAHLHGREVEGSDSCTNTQRQSSRVCIHVLGHFHLVTKQSRGDGCSSLDDLQPSLNITMGIGDSFALFKDDRFGDFRRVLTDEMLQSSVRS